MTQASWVLMEGDGPIVAVALHDGHDARVLHFAITEIDRWRRRPVHRNLDSRGDTQIVYDRDLSLI